MTERGDHDPMPVFTIKAKDELALMAINYYRLLCLGQFLDEQAAEVGKAYDEMRAWRARHRNLVKLPDHPHVPSGSAS